MEKLNHLLGLEGLSREMLTTILDHGTEFKAVSRRRIDPKGNLWLRVLETTGQPPSMKE